MVCKMSDLENDQKRILNEDVSKKILPILRKIVTNKEGTASLANVPGYEVGGKTGTAQKSIGGSYSKKKVNTFASVFPTSDPKFVLAVMLDEPKANREFVYHYRDERYPYKGNWRNTAGWITVWITGQIMDKIGPILAINNKEFINLYVTLFHSCFDLFGIVVNSLPIFAD